MDLTFNVNHLSNEFYQTYTLVDYSEREIYDVLVCEFKRKYRPLIVDFKTIFENKYKKSKEIKNTKNPRSITHRLYLKHIYEIICHRNWYRRR